MKNSMNSSLISDSTSLQRRLRSASPLIGLTLLTLSLVACGSGSTTNSATPAATTPTAAAPVDSTTNPDAATVPFTYDGQDHSWAETSAVGSLSAMDLASGNNDLTSQTWTSATNGWGPVELNMSNGERNLGDGRTLSLNGKTYTSGLGVHAPSQVVYSLGGVCSSFQSDIGLDDEVKSLGSVTFQVWADGTKIYDSGTMTGGQARKFVSVSIAGKNELKLIVTNAGDNANYDHADWAGATLVGCTGTTTGNWSTVASENQSFTLSATSTVRYGAGTSWVQKSLAPGSYVCSNSTFADGAYGTVKHCDVSTVTANASLAAPATINYSGPLVITKGGTYSGNWESQDPNVPAVSVQTSDPVIIENSNIRGRGNLIAGFFNRITIRNVKGYGLNPNVAGRMPGKFVNLEQAKNIDIENNYLEGTSGMYFRDFTGDVNQGDTIKILRNKVLNTDGRQSDGNGGFTTNRNITQAILFNQVQRLPGVEIAWNQVINEPGKSFTEESINMYVSSGTPSSPMQIHDNYFQGAYNAQPWSDSSYAGGGILMGDGTTSDPSAMGNTRVYNNQLVGLSNHSLNIVGGVNNQMYNNRIVYSGFLSDGRVNAIQTVGIVAWDINNMGKYAVPTFWNNSIYSNYVAVTTRNADGSVKSNQPWWTPACGSFNTTCTGNVSGGTATLDMERQEYQSWLDKLSNNGVQVGPK